MNAKRAKLVLLRYLDGSKRHAGDRETEHALAYAKKHPDLENIVTHQIPFDAAFHSAIISVPISATAGEKFGTIAQTWTERRHEQTFSFRSPAILAVFTAFLVMLFVGMWFYLGRSQTYPGTEQVEEIFHAGWNSNIDQFEPMVTDVGKLGDWFTMQGFDGYYVPAGLEKLQTAGVRTFTHEGQKVAMVVIPEGKYFLMIFPAPPFGVEIDPPGSWVLQKTDEGQTFAAQMVDEMCLVISSRDPKTDISSAIRKIEPQATIRSVK